MCGGVLPRRDTALPRRGAAVKLLGGCLLAWAGVWSGLMAAGRLAASVSRCGDWCRMLEILSFELTRFRTPLPELFGSLSDRLEGMPGEVCERAASGLEEDGFQAVWREALSDVPPEEREILRPLGDVLGRFGAEEQAACVDAALERMTALWQERQRTRRERSRVYVGVLSAGGLLLAVLLM